MYAYERYYGSLNGFYCESQKAAWSETMRKENVCVGNMCTNICLFEESNKVSMAKAHLRDFIILNVMFSIEEIDFASAKSFLLNFCEEVRITKIKK